MRACNIVQIDKEKILITKLHLQARPDKIKQNAEITKIENEIKHRNTISKLGKKEKKRICQCQLLQIQKA